MIRRALRVTLTAAIVAPSLCGIAMAEEQPTTLTVWTLPGREPSNDSAMGAGMAAAVSAFENAHPGVMITMQPTPGSPGDLSKLIPLIVAGDPPDVAPVDRFTLTSTALQGYVQSLDNLLPGSPLITRADRPEHIPPGSWREIHGFDGRVYGVPFLADNVGFWSLYYNRTHFQNAGLDAASAPKSWPEFAAYARKLTHRDNAGKLVQIGYKPDSLDILNFTYAAQGKFISDDGRTARFDSPQVTDAVQFLVDNVKDMGGWSGVSGSGASFQNGTASMRSYGEWYLWSLPSHKELDYSVGFIPTPSGQEPTAWIGGWSWAMPVHAKHPQLAAEFLDFAWSRDFASAFIQGAQRWADAHRQVLILPGAFYFSYPDLVRTYNVPSLLARDKRAAAALEHFLLAAQNAYAVYGRWRTPIQAEIWNAVMDVYKRAVEDAKEAPPNILKATNTSVQAQLDEAWQRVDGR